MSLALSLLCLRWKQMLLIIWCNLNPQISVWPDRISYEDSLSFTQSCWRRKILTTQKCCIWASVSFLSLSVISVFWLQTVIALARMLHLSYTLNCSCVLRCWVLSSSQNPWKFLQWLLQCSLQAFCNTHLNTKLLHTAFHFSNDFL